EAYYDYLKAVGSSYTNGKSWNQLVHDGFVATEITGSVSASSDFSSAANTLASTKKAAGLELVLYTKTGMGDGQQANNPWLQEFPDPITRVSWDNYLTVSRADAEELGIKNYNVANGGLNGSYVTVKVGDK